MHRFLLVARRNESCGTLRWTVYHYKQMGVPPEWRRHSSVFASSPRPNTMWRPYGLFQSARDPPYSVLPSLARPSSSQDGAALCRVHPMVMGSWCAEICVVITVLHLSGLR